jgi:uncharacterized protein (DUF169 family)
MTTEFADIARSLVSTLGPVRFVSVAYLKSAPEGVARFSGSVPSSCTFWRLASTGNGFYTVPGDHLNCPIGSYTSGIDLPAERAGELEQALSLMASIGYVKMEEVPSIPRLPQPPAFVYYAPLENTAVPPDVVIAAGRPGALMRLQEASARAGASSQLPLLGRPTCMALPASMAHGSVVSSGCIGNRVYTGLGDDELYLMLPGNRLRDVARELAVIQSANETLQGYHQSRKSTLTS